MNGKQAKKLRIKKMLLILKIIPFAGYVIGFYINWKATLIIFGAVCLKLGLTETWKKYK